MSNPSTWEPKVGGPGDQGRPGILWGENQTHLEELNRFKLQSPLPVHPMKVFAVRTSSL